MQDTSFRTYYKEVKPTISAKQREVYVAIQMSSIMVTLYFSPPCFVFITYLPHIL